MVSDKSVVGVCLSNDNTRNAVELIRVLGPNYADPDFAVMVKKPTNFNCFHVAWNRTTKPMQWFKFIRQFIQKLASQTRESGHR